tara:strand:+ start:2826 stop:2996 length:171 start_codon:yes stop_codon:yes gene_type:complete
MRVEVIEEFCGVAVGVQKELPSNIANNLIERKLVKEIKGDEAPKGKKATKTEETTD